MISEPCYFAEAVYLLYNHINHVSYEEEYKRVTQNFFLDHGNQRHEKMDVLIHELNRIAGEVTAGLDIDNERLQYYFARLPGTTRRACCCLAQVMLMGVPMDCSDPLLFAERLLRDFRAMEAIGMKVNDLNALGLVLERQDPGEEPESLVAQIERLPCSVDAKWMIIRALTDYETHLRELTELLLPITRKLKPSMGRLVEMNRPELEAWGEYFSSHTVDEFQSTMFGSSFLFAEANRPHEIWVSIWHFNFLGFWSEWLSEDGPLPVRIAYIGMGISFDFAAGRKKRPDEETLCGMLRALGGKDKLEILRLCASQPYSAARLADTMSLNSGTVSRNLYGLFKLGFLETKGDGERVNYVTRMEGLNRLFAWILEYVGEGK